MGGGRIVRIVLRSVIVETFSLPSFDLIAPSNFHDCDTVLSNGLQVEKKFSSLKVTEFDRNDFVYNFCSYVRSYDIIDK